MSTPIKETLRDALVYRIKNSTPNDDRVGLGILIAILFGVVPCVIVVTVCFTVYYSLKLHAGAP